MISGTPTTAGGPTSFTVTVTDNNGLTATQALTITIAAAPTLAVLPPPSGDVGVAYTDTLAATGGTGPFTYAVTAGTLPDGLTLSADGVISGTPTTAGGPTSFSVTVTDADLQTSTQPLSITINPVPTLAVLPPPNGEVSIAYTDTLTTTGGTGPFSYAVTTGTLPDGLTLSADGVISGTPTTAGGPTSFSVTVTDTDGLTATQPLTITIAAVPTLAVLPPPNGEVSIAYTDTLTTTGGTGPFTYAVTGVGSLPDGLTLSAGGVISGTPTTAGGPTSFTVTVTDNNGLTATQPLTITIAAIPTLAVLPPPNGEVSIPYADTLTTTGGTEPFSYAITSGTLPDGLTLSADGVISGTPTIAGGPTSFSITVTDANGLTATQALTITIAAIPTLAVLPPPNGEVGIAYTDTLTTTGGTEPFTYAINTGDGSLPDGLTLSSTGVISGTPTTAGGPTSFTVTVTDNNGLTATQALTITIAAIPTLAVLPPPNGEVGIAYTDTLTTTGGTEPFTYAINTGDGSLPDGLTLSSTGVISGTPTTAGGPTSFSITVTDANGLTATQALTITIAAIPTLAVLPPPNGEVGIAYTDTLVATGGAAPYTYAVTTGTLPDGLTLSSTGVISGTPTTAGGPTSFTITVTDNNGLTATQALTITIAPCRPSPSSHPPTVKWASPTPTPSSPPGGAGPLTYAVTTGTLPDGLTLSSTASSAAPRPPPADRPASPSPSPTPTASPPPRPSPSPSPRFRRLPFPHLRTVKSAPPTPTPSPLRAAPAPTPTPSQAAPCPTDSPLTSRRGSSAGNPPPSDWSTSPSPSPTETP